MPELKMVLVCLGCKLAVNKRHRIKEISNKAKELVPKDILNVEEWIDSYNSIMLKLVIDECVQIMREQEQIPAGFLYAKRANIHELAIKKHFGVEND